MFESSKFFSEKKRTVRRDPKSSHIPQGSAGAFACGFLCCALLFALGLLIFNGFMSKEAQIRRRIKKYYLEDISASEISEGKYRGMVAATGDRYSLYYSKEEYAVLKQTNKGVYTGVGIVFYTDPEDGSVMIGDIYEDSPADRAGLLPGDKVHDIDGVEPPELSVSEVAAALQDGTKKEITITVLREGEEEPVTATLMPEEVNLRTVTCRSEDGTGYIAVSNFRETTTEQFKDAYAALMDEGVERLIIDLRDNGGGLVSAAVDMLNVFMPEGLLVYTEEKDGTRKEYTSAGEDPIGIPLAILVNGGTASSAEIFAGAVQNSGTGILVGETTFGKGIVQTTLPLPDRSAVKLTTANYYTPDGKSLNGTGLAPDVEAELPEDALPDAGETDTQYQAAKDALKS